MAFKNIFNDWYAVTLTKKSEKYIKLEVYMKKKKKRNTIYNIFNYNYINFYYLSPSNKYIIDFDKNLVT